METTPLITRCAASVTVARSPPFSAARTGDFVDKQSAGNTAWLRQVRQGDVVVDDDHVDIETLRPCALRGQTEVQPVARIVLDDQQAARLARHRQYAGQHRIHRRRGKNLPADRGGQQALPDEASMAGFMPRAAAGYQRDPGAIPVRSDHHLDMGVSIEPGQPPAGGSQASVNRLGDQGLFRVDELLHWSPSLGDACACGVEIERVTGLNGDAVTRFEIGMDVRQRDDVVPIEIKVKAGLVPQMLDTRDR